MRAGHGADVYFGVYPVGAGMPGTAARIAGEVESERVAKYTAIPATATTASALPMNARRVREVFGAPGADVCPVGVGASRTSSSITCTAATGAGMPFSVSG